MNPDETAIRRIHCGLAPKLIVLVVLATLLVGATVGAFALLESREALRNRVLAGSLKTAELAAQFAAHYLTHLQDDACGLALNPRIVRAAADKSYADASPELARFLRMHPNFDSVSILDVRGIVRVSSVVNHPLLGKSSADRDWFQQAMATQKPFLGAPVFTRATGRFGVPCGVPLLDRRGKPCGALVAGISPDALAKAVVGMGAGPEAHAELIDLRGGGIILAHADPRMLLKPLPWQNEAVRRLLSGKSGALETATGKEGRVLSAFAPVPGFPWGVIITVPHKTAFAKLNALTAKLLLFVLFALTLSAIITGFMARRITLPLRALRNAAQSLAEGNLGVRLNIPGNDEIGEISRVFDQMARRLEAEQTALRRRAENFYNLSLDLLCVIGFDGRLKALNPGWEQTCGFTAEELQSRPFVAFIHPDDRPVLREAAAQLTTGRGVFSSEIRFLHRDGSFRWLIWNAVGVVEERMIYAAAHDVTNLRQAGEALSSSEENFRHSLDESPLGVRIVSGDGETIYANRAILDLYGYDSLEELQATSARERYTPESWMQFQTRREQRRRGEDGPPEYDVDIHRRDGKIRHLHVFRKKVLWSGEMQYQVVYQDVTERTQALEELLRSNREKALLLKEIHHRVKNNLQIIVSLLRLTSHPGGNERVEETLRESRNRVRAMAAVHAMLYKSDNLAGVNFGEYIKETAGELFRSYNASPERISLLIEAEDVTLPIDTAIPCGLIFNELISNALKHALPGSRSGEIRVTMKKEADNIKITFADNGVGFPEGTDFRNTETLGLKLVAMLVGQLDGAIEKYDKDGTMYVITLKA